MTTFGKGKKFSLAEHRRMHHVIIDTLTELNAQERGAGKCNFNAVFMADAMPGFKPPLWVGVSWKPRGLPTRNIQTAIRWDVDWSDEEKRRRLSGVIDMLRRQAIAQGAT